jgi:hypothetical protein
MKNYKTLVKTRHYHDDIPKFYFVKNQVIPFSVIFLYNLIQFIING